MSEVGGYIWFIGLGACLLAIAVAYVVADRRKPKRSGEVGGDPNHAWKQAAADSGHPDVAEPVVTDTASRR